MRRSFVRHLAPSLMLVAAACGPAATGGGDDDDDQPAIDAGFDNDSTTPPVTEECRKMDLIFVIDDSGSMEEEQTNLASNFPMFASLLNSYTISTGETLDYRAAITTTGGRQSQRGADQIHRRNAAFAEVCGQPEKRPNFAAEGAGSLWRGGVIYYCAGKG